MSKHINYCFVFDSQAKRMDLQWFSLPIHPDDLETRKDKSRIQEEDDFPHLESQLAFHVKHEGNSSQDMSPTHFRHPQDKAAPSRPQNTNQWAKHALFEVSESSDEEDDRFGGWGPTSTSKIYMHSNSEKKCLSGGKSGIDRVSRILRGTGQERRINSEKAPRSKPPIKNQTKFGRKDTGRSGRIEMIDSESHCERNYYSRFRGHAQEKTKKKVSKEAFSQEQVTKFDF